MKFIFSALMILILSACTSLGRKPNQFVVERKWARSTLETDYLLGRRMHRFAPIVTDKLVIAANSIDGIVAYDRDTVFKKWRFDIKDGVEGGAQIADGILYFGAGDGQLYALQPDSGTVLWTYPLKAEGLAEPLIRGGNVYVLGGNNVLHVLNAKTGKLLWVFNRREASNLSIRGGSQPALAGDLVLVGFSDGALVALNKNSGSVVWEVNLNRNKRFRDVDATPVVDGETVFISSYDGALYALNRGDGRILWTVEEGGYEEVLVSANTVFFSSTTGKTMALDKSSGKILWSVENPHGIATGPVLYKNTLLVGEMEGALRFLDARNGELMGEFAPGRGVTSKATVDPRRGEVYFLSRDGNLFALRVNWKRYAKDWPWE
jgi:outer membrane protein assembly factor BamB